MGRVLIVDDEPMLRLLLRLVLENDGHDVRDVEDGREGLILIGSWRPDVVVTELSLPGLGGQEWLKRIRLRADSSDIRIVATSSSIPVDAEVDAAFVKPYEAQMVAKEIDAMLSHGTFESSSPLLNGADPVLKARTAMLSEIWNRLVSVDGQADDCDPECDVALEEIRRLATWIDDRASRNQRQGAAS